MELIIIDIESGGKRDEDLILPINSSLSVTLHQDQVNESPNIINPVSICHCTQINLKSSRLLAQKMKSPLYTVTLFLSSKQPQQLHAVEISSKTASG